MKGLKDKLGAKIEATRSEVQELIREHGETQISTVNVAQAYGGMRGVKSLVTETSALDPAEGIRFRGLSIPEVQERLPTAPGGDEPLPEGLLYLLLTGDVPTEEEVRELSRVLRSQESLPAQVRTSLDALPADTHPMTQFSIGIMAMQPESIFARRYSEGMAKSEFWEAMFDDVFGLLARLPLVAAYIYRRSYKGGQHVDPAPADLDWGGNLAHMLGVDDERFRELMRMYLTIHADHEGGNVSAHTTHLVGSALSDPYLCLAAGMNGLAGPLHGLANQEVMRWVLGLREQLGSQPSEEQISRYVWDTLEGGRVVPGFGHAVLRQTDPRYMALRKFALRYMPDDENVRIVRALYDIVPRILEEQGKAKNPWPNVDAHSGCVLVYFGVDQFDFFTVLFGVSRALGVLSSLIWDRALGSPLERPKSVTTDWIRAHVG